MTSELTGLPGDDDAEAHQTHGCQANYLQDFYKGKQITMYFQTPHTSHTKNFIIANLGPA